MATPQYNIKTGADSSIYFSREITQGDVNGTTITEADLGLIKNDQETETDYFKYPVLIRRTGDSLNGSTETIESNELRKGRTKSAPRRGNSSSEGSIDFEFSPETYDDILEAALRNEWKSWTSDTESESNKDKETYEAGYFASKKLNKDGKVIDCSRRLYAKSTELAGIETAVRAALTAEGITNPTEEQIKSHPLYPVLVTDAEVEVAELTCGQKDIRYDLVKQYGGLEGEDLYQDYEHNCVNTVDMSVTPGQIVTGSFGFMGSNNPDMVKTGLTVDGKFEAADGTTVDALTNETDATGLVKVMRERFKNLVSSKGSETVKDFVNRLPEKGTSTDQYTAREGFLYLSGERVRYGSNLTFNLNNGLEKTFAIFEKDAISISPLTLDITGSFSAYLIAGHTETIWNMASNDKDVEFLFCFQDKEEDPEAAYVVQIFKTKLTDLQTSSGAENIECSMNYSSFEEKAMRIFRIRTIHAKKVVPDSSENTSVKIATSTKPDSIDASDIKSIVKIAGKEVESTPVYNEGVITVSWDAPADPSPSEGDTIDVSVSVYGSTPIKTSYKWAE